MVDASELKAVGSEFFELARTLEDTGFSRMVAEASGKNASEKFKLYVDDLAENEGPLRHMYEPDRAGEEGARLFELNFSPGGAGGGGVYENEFIASTDIEATDDPRLIRRVPFTWRAAMFEQVGSWTTGEGAWFANIDGGISPVPYPAQVTNTSSMLGSYTSVWHLYWEGLVEEQALTPQVRAMARTFDSVVSNNIRKAIASARGAGATASLGPIQRGRIQRALREAVLNA